MKYFFLIFFSLFYSLTASAQPSIEWATNYHAATEIKYDKNNGWLYLLGGSDSSMNFSYSATTPNCFQDSINGDTDFYISKFDTLGNRLWATYIGGNAKELIQSNRSMVIGSDGSIFIAGITSSDQDLVTMGSPGSHDNNWPFNNSTYQGEGASGFLAKLDSNGNRLWARYFLDSVLVTKIDIKIDQQDNIIVCGSANGFNQIPASLGSFQQYPANTSNSINNSYLAKFNGSNGSLDWWTYYGGSQLTSITSLAIDSSNNIYFAGITQNQGMATPNAPLTSFTGSMSRFMTKFNTNGEQIWCTYILDNVISSIGTVQILSDGGETIYKLTSTKKNGLGTFGSFQQNQIGETDLLLSSYNAGNGYLNWASYYGTKWDDFGLGMTLNKNNDILLIGQTLAPAKLINTECSLNNEDYRNFIVKFTKDGHREWTSYYDLGFFQGSPYYTYAVRFKDIVAGTGKDIFTFSISYGPNLTTPGAFYENTNLQQTGLLTKFQDTFICPDLNFDITQNNDTLFVTGGYEQYTWFKNGIAIGGSDSFLIIDFSDADYYVKIEDGCGCSYQTGVFGVTSISDREQITSIRLFPNPNKGKFWLKSKVNILQENILYTVSDLRGKVLQKGSFRVKNRIIDQEMDCSGLTAGMYFLELKLKEGRVVLKLVVKD